MAMDKSAADSYVYAKASGMLARSFVGARSERLFSAKSLQELWTLLFKKEIPAVPETLFAKALEKQAADKFISDFKSLLQNYSKPSPVLLSLLSFYDYDNLKEFAAALCLKEKKIPSYQSIAPFNLIDYSKWPDLAAITCGGPLEWYNTVPELSEQKNLDYKLDCQYMQSLWNSLRHIDSECRNDLKNLIGDKLNMNNALWALRLKLYYDMSREEILDNLIYSNDEKSENDPLVLSALEIIDKDTDDWESWKNWKYAELLNPHEEGVVWTVDARWISNAYKHVYLERARRLFHRHPFTECPLVCWFIIKRNELDNIRMASESLRLNISSIQAMQMAGISEVKNG